MHALQVIGQQQSEGGKRLQMLVERQVLRTLDDYEGHQIVSLVRRLSLLSNRKTLEQVVDSVMDRQTQFQNGEVIRIMDSAIGSYAFEETLIDRTLGETLSRAAQLTT